MGAGGASMNYPAELDTDDIEELASYIAPGIRPRRSAFTIDTIHFAYWDKSHRVVSAMLLDHIQAAGYRVLHTGVATIPRRAWMECRKHEPGEETDESNVTTITCDHCEETFSPDEARTRDDILYTCPGCYHWTDGPPPRLDRE
jgi:hypothetical protein